MDVSEFESMLNIGKVLAQMIAEIGICSQDEFRELGAENIFLKMKSIEKEPGDCCINKLYAIEGAVQGIRWHNLDKERKYELKCFFNSIK